MPAYIGIIWIVVWLLTFFILIFIFACRPYDKYNPSKIRLPGHAPEETMCLVMLCALVSTVWIILIPTLLLCLPIYGTIKLGNHLSKNGQNIVKQIITKTLNN
uniref:Uncharacterized protein n=1 Tax=viral metagenome TaxID=1070528 RepID=A0A6M3LHV6_9ZZZZ